MAKTPEDFYEDAYAREQGKIHARWDAQRAAARARSRATLITCGVLAGVPLLLCGGCTVLGLVVSATKPDLAQATAAASSSSDRQTERTTAKDSTPPTTRRAPKPTEPAPPTEPEPPPTTRRVTEPTTPATKPEPPKLPKVTITPPKETGWVILGGSKLVVTEAAASNRLFTKWKEEGAIVVLTEPTEVEVVKREKDICRIKLNGKEWVVESKFVPTEK